MAESQVALGALRRRLAGVVEETVGEGLVNRFRDALRQVQRHYPAQLSTTRFLQALELIDLPLRACGHRTGTLHPDRRLGVRRPCGTRAGPHAPRGWKRSGPALLRRPGLARRCDADEPGPPRSARSADRGRAGARTRGSLAGRPVRSAPWPVRGDVGRLEVFLRDLADLTGDDALRRRVMQTLIDRPDLRLDAVMLTVEKLGRLPDEAVHGLAALGRTGLTANELRNLLRASERGSLEQLFGLARALGPTDLEAVLQHGVALQFARAPAAARLLAGEGWAGTSGLLRGRFDNSVRQLDDFALWLEEAGLDGAGRQSVLEALATGGAASDASIRHAASAFGRVTPFTRRNLDKLYALSGSGGVSEQSLDQLVARMADRGEEPLRRFVQAVNDLEPSLLGPLSAGTGDALETLAGNPRLYSRDNRRAYVSC